MTISSGAIKNCLVPVLAFLSVWEIFSAEASLLINEVAYKGSGNSNCNGDDWVELLNTDEEAFVNLTNYVLHDDNGENDDDAMTFTGVIMAPGEFLVLCKEKDFGFGIGSDDTVTLLDTSGIITSSVTLPGTRTDEDTYAYIDGEYKYTATPTPGGANIYTEPAPLEEKLTAQNDAGNDFFLVNDAEVFTKVVDIYISADDDSLAMIEDHPAWEEYVPFSELSVSNIGNTTANGDSLAVSRGGRIRVKGFSSNTITVCFGLKNVPFSIKFDTPFLGMEEIYLRNHFADPSFMRDHASHTMLKAFGLPYLRTRPARLFLNGEYTGFYTLMEAPTQGYVMQRSFGTFDPEMTALFKVKIGMDQCPFDDDVDLVDTNDPPPDPYYFERGDHREDTPVVGGMEGISQCASFFFGEVGKEFNDLKRGFLEYDKKCGLSMVELGRVDRDYGPKSLEDPMVSFLDDKFYNESIHDLTDYIDADQWIQNLAVYAIMLNIDSPLLHINNFYLATTKGGVDDWRIVQYDHNAVTTRHNAEQLCNDACGPRMAYWSILQPTCTAIKDHKIVGRVLNSEENMQIYLDYIQEYVDIMMSSSVVEKLYDYGNNIKEYVADDPWNLLKPIEAYEESELGANIQDYNTDASPFLKSIQVRLEQVQMQLDAIQEGTLPRDGVYNPEAVCPDWRDNGSEVFVSGSTIGDDCQIPFCEEAAVCYENSVRVSCSPDGDLLLEDCKGASPFCDSCFPYSRCGTGTLMDPSGNFVESESCGSELAECKADAKCFDHNQGSCAFDGEILTVECQSAVSLCEPCFPYSRCGSGEEQGIAPDDVLQGGGDESGLFVESESCGPELALCAQAALCFDHTLENCGDDGSITSDECQQALPFCQPCFPNSRCGSGDEPVDSLPQDIEGESRDFVESESCPPALALCAQGSFCFDHNKFCGEDGSVTSSAPAECQQALSFCRQCFPYSRCGVQGSSGDTILGDISGVLVESDSCGPEIGSCADASYCFDHTLACEDDGSAPPECWFPFCKPCFPNSRCGSGENIDGELATNDEYSASEIADGAHRPRVIGVPGILMLMAAGLLWCWMAT